MNNRIPLPQERSPFRYPERPSFNVEEKIDRLQKLENGVIEPASLDEKEREQFKIFERSLGERLEKIYNLSITSHDIYPEYFLTEAGKKLFIEEIGNKIGMAPDWKNADEITRDIYAFRHEISKLPQKQVKEVFGQSCDHADNRLREQLADSMDEYGNISLGSVGIPPRINILVDPVKAAEKIKRLREFKRELKQLETVAKQFAGHDADDYHLARLGILALYRQVVNEMIADQYSVSVRLARIKECLGDDRLADEEKEIMRQWSGHNNAESHMGRYDKFRHGIDAGAFDEKGNYLQVNRELVSYADKVEQEFVDNVLNQDQRIRQRGFDPDKILRQKDIPEETFREWAEDMLQHLGIKSQYSGKEYDPNRPGPAPDDQWQFVTLAGQKNMETSSKKKVLFSSRQPKTVYEAIATMLGHEAVHICQSLNKEAVTLRLFSRIGSDRAGIFSEGGAMMLEDEIAQQAFGSRKIPKPHYVRAMDKRLEGGNYLECVRAYYNSSMKHVQLAFKQGRISGERLHDEALLNLELAIRSTKRLFANGGALDSTAPYLSSSRDTVYLEQKMLLDKLKEKKLEKYAMVGRVNLDTLAFLSWLGEIKLNNIRQPKDYALQVWDREKEKYRIEK